MAQDRKTLTFGSVCSGIEAACVAWKPLGWECAFVSEIEKFPNAVLKHRYPQIQNLGDMTSDDFIKQAKSCGKIDLLSGGTPCQSFSVAGKRKSLSDERGNLTLRFIEIAHELRPTWIVWENVQGVLNTEDNAFGCFLAGLVGADAPLVSRYEGGAWPSAGIADGPIYGVAWRILDAQHFGVPQRRRRVWVVGYLGDWRRAAQVLFESKGMCWNPQTSEEARERVAPTISARTKGGGGLGTDFDLDGGLICKCLKAGSNKQDPTHETYIVMQKRMESCNPDAVAHTLRGEGFDASEDGTGRGTPIIADTLRSHPRPGSNSLGNVIAFSSKDHGADAGDKAPTLRAGGHDESHPNAGVPPAVVYDMRGNGDGDKVPNLTGDHAGRPTDYTPMVFEPRLARNDRGAPDKICPPLKAQSGQTGKGDAAPVVFQQNSRSEVRLTGGDGKISGSVTSQPGVQQQNYAKIGMTVRRLMPIECERLQDFGDNHTKIPWRGKPADQCPDGPRHKAIGNSWAVCCARWIGKRIDLVRMADAPL